MPEGWGEAEAFSHPPDFLPLGLCQRRRYGEENRPSKLGSRTGCIIRGPMRNEMWVPCSTAEHETKRGGPSATGPVPMHRAHTLLEDTLGVPWPNQWAGMEPGTPPPSSAHSRPAVPGRLCLGLEPSHLPFPPCSPLSLQRGSLSPGLSTPRKPSFPIWASVVPPGNQQLLSGSSRGKSGCGPS